MMPQVQVIAPQGIDDPLLPSGGNRYDRRVIDELENRGWLVHETLVAGPWPHPDAAACNELAGALQRAEGTESVDAPTREAPALVDGLIACGAPDLVTAAAADRDIALLMHMPFGPSGEPFAEPQVRLLRAVARVVATSRWTAHHLKSAYGVEAGRITVATPGVDLAGVPGQPAAATPRRTSAPGHGSEPGGLGNRLLCVAAVTPRKGYATLVTALADLVDVPWTCRCVGSLEVDAGFAHRIAREVSSAGLADRVRLVGPVHHGDLDDYYGSADLVIVPSFAESYGMVVTEALAHGIPVIASDVGGLPEALGVAPDGVVPGVLVAPGDPTQLASAVRSWLGDAGLRRSLRDAAWARRSSLTGWGGTAAQVATALRSFAHGGGSSPSSPS